MNPMPTWLAGLALLAAAVHPARAADPTGDFVSLFDGETLDGWQGDRAVWSVRGGAITGQTTAETKLAENNFLVWKDGVTTSPVSMDGRKGDRLTAAEPLYTREGTDPSFAAVLKSGGITPGERFSKGPVLGSRIHVNHELLEKQVGKTGPIPKDIGIHTQGSGGIPRRDFGKWTRWYQEDGNTQVFRLFQGEQNVRDGLGRDGSPGRVEAFSRSLTVAPGTWREWEGAYTVIEPVGAAIFQLFHEDSLWAFHIQMSDSGAIYLNRRRPKAGEQKRITLAENMVGKTLGIKVRANGKNYQVYRRTAPDGPYELMAEGSYTQARDNKISFRWGIYVGSRTGQSVPKDAMLFVTGATVR